MADTLSIVLSEVTEGYANCLVFYNLSDISDQSDLPVLMADVDKEEGCAFFFVEIQSAFCLYLQNGLEFFNCTLTL